MGEIWTCTSTHGSTRVWHYVYPRVRHSAGTSNWQFNFEIYFWEDYQSNSDDENLALTSRTTKFLNCPSSVNIARTKCPSVYWTTTCKEWRSLCTAAQMGMWQYWKTSLWLCRGQLRTIFNKVMNTRAVYKSADLSSGWGIIAFLRKSLQRYITYLLI